MSAVGRSEVHNPEVYLPLGGRRSVWATPAVFAFSALWHEATPALAAWAGLNAAALKAPATPTRERKVRGSTRKFENPAAVEELRTGIYTLSGPGALESLSTAAPQVEARLPRPASIALVAIVNFGALQAALGGSRGGSVPEV